MWLFPSLRPLVLQVIIVAMLLLLLRLYNALMMMRMRVLLKYAHFRNEKELCCTHRCFRYHFTKGTDWSCVGNCAEEGLTQVTMPLQSPPVVLRLSESYPRSLALRRFAHFHHLPLLMLFQVSSASDSSDDNFVWNFPVDVTFKCATGYWCLSRFLTSV